MRSAAADFLAGGGELGARLRAFDWKNSPIGAPETWPQSLKTAIRIMLTSRQPIWIGWGKELIYLYNDAYKSIIGGKHPWALGRPTREVWQEIREDIGPMLDTAMTGVEGTYVEEQLLIMERHGYPEETYYTFSYSPVPDDDGSAGGIICANTDDTQRVIGERQLALLRELATATTDARTWQDACQRGAQALETNRHDLPFAMIYMAEPESGRIALAASSGIEPGHAAAPASIARDASSPWPIRRVLERHEIELVPDLGATLANLPVGVWRQPPRHAAVLPIPATGPAGRAGVLVVGLNPFRLFDDGYRGFLGLIAGQIAAAVTNANAYQEERRRAEALAELDRAKTVFFSNVSHEFRTPLTLMLGTLEEVLGAADLPDRRRGELMVTHRNSMRLLRLVNTLLDFSRVEAGRIEASYEPVDLAALTSALASNFRSACERAGLDFDVECVQLREPVFVDRDMWEKIVLNLISNAFKFTLQGGIDVRLTASGGFARLSVSDTGTGIPKEELPRVFDRFHRVAGVRGRTHEGTGIGLALVQELVGLHGGTVEVQSAVGEGSVFTVSIPLGSQHLPAGRIGAVRARTATSVRAQSYVDEALRWLPDGGYADDRPTIERGGLDAPAQPISGAPRSRVLVVEDNADMRDYIARLLLPFHDVDVAPDGLEGLARIVAGRPDLVLSDVMMPGLDGVGLLRAIRADAGLRDLPVILLSARAGEEAEVQGLEAGADDYLVKPFSARELLARVNAHLQIAKVRKDALEAVQAREHELQQRATQLEVIMNTVPAALWLAEDPQATKITGSRKAAELLRLRQGANHSKSAPATERPVTFRAMKNGRELAPDELPVQRACRGEEVRLEELDLVFSDGSVIHELMNAAPVRDAKGEVIGAVGAAIDITDRRRAEDELRASEARLRALVSASSDVVYRMSPDWSEMRYLMGRDFIADTEQPSRSWLKKYIDPIDQPRVMEAIHQAISSKGTFQLEHRVLRVDGALGWTFSRAVPLLDANGEIAEWFGAAVDITERKRAEEQRELLINELNHRVKNTLATVQSIAMQTMRSSASPAEFQDAFVSRLMALSRAHDLLTRGNWQAASFLDIVRETLEPYGAGGRVEIGGPSVRLSPAAAVTLSMALHELATNAAKYGALSAPSGRIAVNWAVDGCGQPAMRIDWIERDGPNVAPPGRRGFGSRLIERGIAQELDGDVSLDFHADGVRCRISLPLSDRVSAP